MNKSAPLIMGIFFILLGITLGAFGAHILSDQITQKSMAILDVATDYLFYQGIGLLAIYLLFKQKEYDYKKVIVRMLGVGTILFSGSLILLAVKSIMPTLPISILGPMTPIGGTLMIFAWAILLFQSVKNR